MHNEQDQDEIMSRFSKREAAEIMTKVAIEFGAKNEDSAVDEMMEVYEFWQKSEAPVCFKRSDGKLIVYRLMFSVLPPQKVHDRGVPKEIR